MMRLSAVNLHGFKSFCDRAAVSVNDGLTGIVGPNGCGKSNIIDALRWGLGESRASLLRGDALQDVLFNGSGKRPPSDLCVVEMHFTAEQNDDLGMWSGCPQIVVKRELGRDGQSYFYINQQPARRRDVVDLFRGTGVSPRSYAVVEQGMVGSIAEASADSLRQFLEEAAGVSHYKDRRRDAERRLESCRINLEQLAQLLDVARRRQDSLKRQARAARKYNEISDSINDLEVLLILQNRTVAEQQLATKTQEIDTLGQKIESLRGRLETLRTGTEKARVRHGELQQQAQTRETEWARAQSAADRIRHDYEQAEQNRRRLQSRVVAEKSEQAETVAAATQTAADWQRTQSEIDGIGGELEKCIAAAERQSDEIGALQESLRSAEQQLELARREVYESEQHRETRRIKIQMTEERRGALHGRLVELRAAMPSADMPPPPITDDVARRAAACEESLRVGEAACKSLAAEEESARATLHQTENAKIAAEAELAALQSMLKKHEWRTDNIPPRLSGALQADAGEWARALDAALGRFADAHAVSSVADFLQAHGMPPAGVGVVEMPMAAAQLPPMSARWTTLLSLIKTSTAADFLAVRLRGVYAAESDDMAQQSRAQLQDDEMMITRAGTIFMRDAVFAPDEVRGGFDWQQQLATLADAVADNADMAKIAAAAAQAARTKLNDAEAMRAKAVESLTAARAELSERRVEFGQWEERCRAVERRRREVDAEMRVAGESVQELEDELAQLAAESNDESCELAQVAMNAAKTVSDAAIQQLESKRGEFNQSNIFRRELHLREENLGQHLRALTARRDELARRKKTLSERIAQSETEIAQFSESALATALTQHTDEMTSAQAAFRVAAAEVEEWAKKITVADGEREQQLHLFEQLQKENTVLQVQQRELSMALEGLNNSLEDFVLDESRLAPLREVDIAAEERRAAIDDLRGRREKLGAINFAAAQELSDSANKSAEMQAQLQDIESATEELQKTIRRIDDETRTRLREVYEAINREFGGLFRKLFGGGEAELAMQGNSFLDAQFEIRARPPGKRMFPVRLLSGGEKSATALAFIFALMRHKPPPFCIMDEVDATLDDSRVDAFVALLQEMAERFQCLVVTHNKNTIESMRHLIGVTQEEKGVSKIVSVSRAEALREVS